MDTLKILQKLYRLGRILSKIAYVCAIVAACLCAAGIASFALGAGTLRLGGVTIRGLVRADTSLSEGALYAAMTAGLIVMAGEAVLSRFAAGYFAQALADGTPFRAESARSLLRLGILTICIPLGVVRRSGAAARGGRLCCAGRDVHRPVTRMPLRRGADGGAEVTEPELLTLTPENLPHEHLCCIIRTKKPHPGVETKRAWLRDRLGEGHVFRKLDEKACVFIEYAPLESAWVPIVGDNYIYIYCLWVLSENKGKGYGRRLMESCITDAKAQGKSGVCMLGAKKQKAWLSDQSFAKKFGFEMVDETENGYELLALSFDGTKPRFAENAKKETIDSKKLIVYYDAQCPFIPGRIESNRKFCEENGIDADFIEVDSLEKAKNLPCVFNNWAVFCGGKFVTVNLLDERALKQLSDGGK